MIDYAHARRSPPGRGDRRRPARPGGGPRAAEPRPQRRRGARRPHLMNAQLGRDGGEILRREHGSSSASTCITRHPHHRDLGTGQGRAASGCGTRPRSTATWSWSPPASGRTPTWPSPAASPSSGRSSSTTRCAPWTTPTSTRWASACSTAARSTAWSRRCGSRPWCWPTRSPAPTRAPPTSARGRRPSSRWPASTWPRWACTEPERDTDEHIVFSEPQQRRLQVAGHPRRQAHRRDPARRQLARSPS